MKDTFDIFVTSIAKDANKRNTKKNSNLNNKHHKVDKTNDNKNKSTQKETQQIIFYNTSLPLTRK